MLLQGIGKGKFCTIDTAFFPETELRATMKELQISPDTADNTSSNHSPAGLPNIVLQYYCSLKIKIAGAYWAKIIIAAFCFTKK